MLRYLRGRVVTLRLALLLMDTDVGDEGLRQLGKMTQVRTLYLGGSKVTDGGMAYLKGWTRLEDLGVSNTQVGDAGMRLVDGHQLTGLGARNTRISPAGFSRISKVHPKIVIRGPYQFEPRVDDVRPLKRRLAFR
jgi:hypothetical protein